MTVALAALSTVIALLLAERHLAERAWSSERRRLTSMIVARHAGDLVVLDAVQQPPKPKPEPTSPEEHEMIGVGGH